MTMKLGTYGTCPLTGKRGWLRKYIGTTPIYQADDGTLFRRAPAVKGRKCRIRIKGLAPDSPWLEGEMVGRTRAKVTSLCPIWHGAIVGRDSADILLERE